jgi:hypothetical protein
MIHRCSTKNVNDVDWKDYAGRGIQVCARWRSYLAFKEDMGPSFQVGLSIDRIDNDGNYEPTNCRWATAKQQARNKRTSRFIEFGGQRKTSSEWAEVLGVRRGLIEDRLKLGWSVDRALTEPARPWAPGTPMADMGKDDPSYVRSTDGNKKIEDMA